MKKIKLLLTLVLSLLFAANAWADDEKFMLDLGADKQVNLAHWVSELPDDMRLTQMSIPKAHDAGTWSANHYNIIPMAMWWKDQDFDERTLFSLHYSWLFTIY